MLSTRGFSYTDLACVKGSVPCLDKDFGCALVCIYKPHTFNPGGERSPGREHHGGAPSSAGTPLTSGDGTVVLSKRQGGVGGDYLSGAKTWPETVFLLILAQLTNEQL